MASEQRNQTARHSGRSVQTLDPRLRATCLLCRVLLPIFVQHRHLIFEEPFELKTAPSTQTDPPRTATAT